MRQFTNTNDRPTNTLRDGAQTRFGGTYSYYLGPGLVLIVQGFGQREDAEVGFYANIEVGASAGIAWTFANPLAAAGRYPWTLQVGAGGINRTYDDADPTINPFNAEVSPTVGGSLVTSSIAAIYPLMDQRFTRAGQSPTPLTISLAKAG